MQASDRFRVADGLEQEPIDDRLLLYDPNGGKVLELNASAALVVQLCDGERSVADIAKAIADAFPDAAGDIAVEIPVLVEELVKDGVLNSV